MNATSLYMNTCRLVMQVDVKSEDILDELNNLLPYLRQSLVCNICDNILINPCSSKQSSCQHYVCKMCISLDTKSKLSCSGCNNLQDQITYNENTQLQLILKCYKKLCCYIKNTNLYNLLSRIKTDENQCDLSLTNIIDEALSEESHSSIGPIPEEVNALDLITEIDSDEPGFYSSDITDIDDDKVVTSTSVSDEGIDIVLPPDQSSREDYFTSSEDNIDKLSDSIKIEDDAIDLSSDCIKLIDPDTNLSSDLHKLDESNIYELKNNDIRHEFSKSYSHEISHCDSPLLTVDSSDIAPIVEIPLLSSSLASPIAPFKNLSTTSSFVSLDEISCPSNHDRLSDELSVHSFHDTDTGTDDNTDQFEKSPIQNLDEESESQDNSAMAINYNNVNGDVITTPSTSLSTMSNNFSRIYNGVNVSESSAFEICVDNNLAMRLSSPNSLKTNVHSVVCNNTTPQPLPPINDINNVKLRTSSNAFTQPVSVTSSIMPSLNLSTIPNMSNCIFNIQPGTILTSSNVKLLASSNVKPFIQESAGTLKQNAVHNNSSMYSVMYNNNDSTGTKITIKRKPPDIENINKISVDPEKINPNSQIIPKKVKPKPKPKPKRKGCRCGNATPTPGKLTCCGQRCPCYVEAKACLECQCRGCRNPHRPGGKKVRPVIPQLGNIQIHQVQSLHQKTIVNQALCNTGGSLHSLPNATPIITSGGMPIRTVHTMHAIHGMGQLHNIQSGMHQLINIGAARSVMDTSSLTSAMHSDMTIKPINIALQSIPVSTQLFINDEKSISNSENSDVDIDI